MNQAGGVRGRPWEKSHGLLGLALDQQLREAEAAERTGQGQGGQEKGAWLWERDIVQRTQLGLGNRWPPSILCMDLLRTRRLCDPLWATVSWSSLQLHVSELEALGIPNPGWEGRGCRQPRKKLGPGKAFGSHSNMEG